MTRLIKRYGSRKLYDTTDSRYVSLEEVAGFVRDGADVHVIDNRSGDDVTAVILSQIVAEEGRAGSGLSSGFLHDLVRVGERALAKGSETLKKGEEAVGAAVTEAKKNVDGLVGRAARTIRSGGPIGEVRDEMQRLRERLEALEASLADLDDDDTPDA